MMSKNKMIFDTIERQIILDFYKESETKSNFWIWWHKNVIVSRYETIKAQRDFYKTLIQEMQKSMFYKVFYKFMVK